MQIARSNYIHDIHDQTTSNFPMWIIYHAFCIEVSCVKGLTTHQCSEMQLMTYPQSRQVTEICHLTLHCLCKAQTILSISVWWHGSTTLEPCRLCCSRSMYAATIESIDPCACQFWSKSGIYIKIKPVLRGDKVYREALTV